MMKINFILGLALIALVSKAQWNQNGGTLETAPNVTAVKFNAPFTINNIQDLQYSGGISHKASLLFRVTESNGLKSLQHITVDDNTSEIEYLFGSYTHQTQKNEKIIFRSFKARIPAELDVLTITSDGKVGIGNSSPSKTFEVNGESFLNGSVGIGTQTTGSHMLAVEGSIGARKIKVEATGWSDFVFAEDYNLKSLNEVKSFVENNNHLPDVPSETEVLEGGVDLAKMDATLLQKIEELTLYFIQMNERFETLEAENAALKANK